MSLRIAEVADAAGVNKETLRYYERRGLLQIPSAARAGIAATAIGTSRSSASSRSLSDSDSPWPRSLACWRWGVGADGPLG